MDFNYVELFGYAASAFVAISLLMVSLLKLRVLNLIGCTFFVIYGLFLHSFPIVIANGFIMLINIYYLIQMYRKDISSFEYVRVDSMIDDLMSFIVVKHQDITKWYPNFRECYLRAAAGGRGLIYAARKGGRNQGFAYALKGESLDLSSFCGDDAEIKAVMGKIGESEYAGAPVFFVDYIVRKYRDLGLAGKFHEKLVEDLQGDYSNFLWLLPASNHRMKRLLISLGYRELFTEAKFEVLSLELKSAVH